MEVGKDLLGAWFQIWTAAIAGAPAWLEDEATKTCQPPLLIYPRPLREVLGSRRDKEVTSGVLTHTGWGSTPQPLSLFPRLTPAPPCRDCRKWSLCLACPTACDRKGSWQPAGEEEA